MRTLGASDAAANFGLSKQAASVMPLLGGALGAGAGMALSDRDEKTQGGILGGVGGLMAGSALGSGLGWVGNKARGAWNAAAKSPWLNNAAASASAFAQRVPGLKFADYSMGASVPNVPIGISMSQHSERLPGMHRWVDRGLIERAHEALDAGLDPADVIDMERSRGTVKHPLTGAAVGGALAHFGLGGNPLTTALGTALGAGAGAVYNQFTAPIRETDAYEALNGVSRERSRFPISSQAAQTANESTPMVVSGGG